MPSNWGGSRPHKRPGRTGRRTRQEFVLARLEKRPSLTPQQKDEMANLKAKLRS